jgi:hypothetical protein
MKTRYISLFLCFALIGFLAWWLLHEASRRPDHKQFVAAKISATNNALNTPTQTLTNSIISGPIVSTPTQQDYTAFIEKRRKQIEEDTLKGVEKWRTPIEFYGKVIDENTNPVSGAEIDFDCNDTSATGTSFYHATSDNNGLFSIKDIQGLMIVVKVNKHGYYPNAPAGYAFYYAGQNKNFIPDAANPVVFYLRKKGVGDVLFHFHKSFRVPRDGTPILIDLTTGNITLSMENAVQIEGWTHDKEKKQGWKYDWKCQVSIPGGGLQIYNEQYPFQAPQTGYIASDLIDMTVTNNAKWTYDVQRNYYIQTSATKFGRMVFGMVAGGDNFCVIDSFFNPSGSRNLEPIPSE